jgi:hypothetical protein
MTGQTAPERRTGRAAVTFGGYEYGRDRADPVGRAILASRKAVLPHPGLLP